MHDDILTQLSKVSALRVISRTSVERFRKTQLSMEEIAKQLGVKTILEGGVQRVGDRVRINVQLIDAFNDAHIWAETYDRELTAADIFAIQSEVAAAIASALKAALTPAEKARAKVVPTESLDAWEAYQLGNQRMSKRTSAALVEAERHFRTAIALDPQFALAYIGLADALQLGIDYGGKPLDVTAAEADKIVSKALALDATLAEAWASKGGIAMSRGQAVLAEKLLRRAIELNPNYAPAHHWLSMVLTNHGKFAEGLEHAERAAQLDPLSTITQVNVGRSLEVIGRFDEAAARYGRAVELDSAAPQAITQLAMLNAYARNRFAEALLLQSRAVALDKDNPNLAGDLAMVWWDVGDQVRTVKLIESLLRQWPDDLSANFYFAVLTASVGNHAVAAAHASKVFSQYPRIPLMIAVLRNEDLRRGNLGTAKARYATVYPELLRKTGPEVTRETSRAPSTWHLSSAKWGTPTVRECYSTLASWRPARCSDSASVDMGLRMYGFTPCGATNRRHSRRFALQNKLAGVVLFGATTATSTRASLRFAMTLSSRLCSPTLNVTWHVSERNSRLDRKTPRSSFRFRSSRAAREPKADRAGRPDNLGEIASPQGRG
jgi:TolB-like protein/Flp pilus assembly protein TadD